MWKVSGRQDEMEHKLPVEQAVLASKTAKQKSNWDLDFAMKFVKLSKLEIHPYSLKTQFFNGAAI